MGRNVQHQGIPVKTDQRALRSDSTQDFAAVAPGTHGSVDDNQPGLKL